MRDAVKVDLALAYPREGEIRVGLVSGPRQESYVLPRQVAATLIGELARALATGTEPKSSARTDDSDGR